MDEAQFDNMIAEFSSDNFDDQLAYNEAKEGGAWETFKNGAVVTAVVTADLALVGGIIYGGYRLATR